MKIKEYYVVGLLVLGAWPMFAGVALSDGVDEVLESGGVWSASQVPPTAGILYQAITRDGTRNQTFAATRVDGGVDIHNFNGVWGTDFQVGSPVVYAGIDAFANKQYDYLAARADGGFDEVFFGASWLTAPIPINGVSTPVIYQAVATDDVASGPGTTWEFFAARAGGGMDMFLTSGPGWLMISLGQVGSTEYVAMTSDINESRKYYAAKAGGGIDLVTESTVGELPGTAGLQYVSLAADKGVDDRLYGVKPDGGLDIISLSGGTWSIQAIPISGSYTAVTTRDGLNDLWAVARALECGDPGTLVFPADINHDCYVDVIDLAEFVSQWLQCSNSADPGCQ